MKLPEEVLKDLTEATIEAKKTIRDLHEARATAMDIDKKQKDQISRLIIDEVNKQTQDYADEAKEQIRKAVEHVIDQLTKTLTERLAL